jgi:hypothetical protein
MVKYYLTANKDLMYDTESERIVANEVLDECILDTRVCVGVESLVRDYLKFTTYLDKVDNEWLPCFRILEENLVGNIGYDYWEIDRASLRDLLHLRDTIKEVEALRCYLSNMCRLTASRIKGVIIENLEGI